MVVLEKLKFGECRLHHWMVFNISYTYLQNIRFLDADKIIEIILFEIPWFLSYMEK